MIPPPPWPSRSPGPAAPLPARAARTAGAQPPAGQGQPPVILRWRLARSLAAASAWEEYHVAVSAVPDRPDPVRQAPRARPLPLGAPRAWAPPVEQAQLVAQAGRPRLVGPANAPAPFRARRA